MQGRVEDIAAHLHAVAEIEGDDVSFARPELP